MKKEIELKYQLSSKEDLSRFEHYLMPLMNGAKKTLHQENFYFDTPELDFKKNGISLRLRKQNEEFLLSAKQSIKRKKTGYLSVRLEYEQAIDAFVADLLIKEYLSPIDAFFVLTAKSKEQSDTQKILYKNMKDVAKIGLQMVGSFINLRLHIPIKLNNKKIALELDHVFFPKKVEAFEVEAEFKSVEIAQKLRPALDELFLDAEVKTASGSSKSSRLFRLLFDAGRA